MKRVITFISAITVSAGLLSGCLVKIDQPQQIPQDVKQDTSVSPQQTPDTSGFIGEERAKEIALERAGISADGVRFDRVELDRDDGIWQYEVDFRAGKTEYDVDIKADDGTVLSFESDYND